MKLGRILTSSGPAVVKIEDGAAIPLDLKTAGFLSLQELLASDSVFMNSANLKSSGNPLRLSEAQWLPPIDQQEVWAAGVTYKRSQTARMEESEAAASCYDRVYTAARP
jgi:2-dehydro-3-deoxy-D-arabinonate dehydratase